MAKVQSRKIDEIKRSIMDHSLKAAKSSVRALFASSLLSEPLTVFLCLLPFILAKDLHASAWQISLLVSLRPIMSLVSFYSSAVLRRKPQRIKVNLIVSSILARLPFLFIFFFKSTGYIVFAAAMHILFSRASIPAWMEVLKGNLEKQSLEKFFSLSSMAAYAEGVGIGFAIGFFLDLDSSSWRYLCFASSVVGLFSVFWQAKISLGREESITSLPCEKLGIMKTMTQPWKDSFRLMRTTPDFARFQWSFMLGGSGVMLIIAVLPIFFADSLKISHKEFSTARAVCMGIGFVFTSGMWGKALSRYSFSSLVSLVTFFFAIFGTCLFFAPYQVFWIYGAYLVYGIAQGGSHILWHLSGPVFAGKDDSLIYSGINVVMVGLRGMVFPLLGSILAVKISPIFVIALGSCLCGVGAIFSIHLGIREWIKSRMFA